MGYAPENSSVHAAGTPTVNSDLGESFGLHSFGNDLRLRETIDVANVACGFHSGDPDTLAATVKATAEHDVKAGAHPGLPDLVGFVRREMKLLPSEVENLILHQSAANRVRRAMAEGAVDGSLLSLECDSICVISDAPNSVTVAAAVRSALTPAG